MLNAEFVKAIGDMALKAGAPSFVAPGQEPSGVYYIRDQGGELKLVHAEPPYRQHQAGDLSAVVEFAKRFAENTPVIWYHRDKVVCVIDDNNRRDAVTLPLDLSVQVLTLRQWEKNQPYLPQATAVLTLRTVFESCLGMAGGLIDVLRKVKFRTTADGSGEVQHGKASVGRAIESEITGAGAIPEYVAFDVPIFGNALAHRGTIRCALEPNPAAGSVAFIPLPGEIEKAVAKAEGEIRDDLGELLGDAKVPVYYGRP